MQTKYWLAGLSLMAAAVAVGIYVTHQAPAPTPKPAPAFNNGMTNHLFGHDLFLEAKTDRFASLPELDRAAPLIVIATKKLQQPPTVNYDADGRIEIAYTRSNFIVDQVIRGSQLHPGEAFDLLENEADNAKQGLTYHIAGYTLMDVGARYLLFLTYSAPDGWYLVQGMNTGKVALTSAGTTHADRVLRTIRVHTPHASEAKAAVARELLATAARDARIHEAARAKYAQPIAATP